MVSCGEVGRWHAGTVISIVFYHHAKHGAKIYPAVNLIQYRTAVEEPTKS
jgi:hypothetical protein